VKPKIPAKDSFSLPLTIVTGHMQPGGHAKQKVIITSEGRLSKFTAANWKHMTTPFHGLHNKSKT